MISSDLVNKGKRSQRQRPSSSEDAIGDGRYSPSLMMLEEDHQAAKCLMLLARGDYEVDWKNEMLRGRKSWFAKQINGGVYECKTCNRTFQSFQALGGHRTSHKKMKIANKELLNPEEQVTKQSDHDGCHQLGGAAKGRVHECVICGAEFASGQALGGHMRRHRVAITLETTPRARKETNKSDDGITLSLLSPATEETGNENNEFQCLDLNLPAEDESPFCFVSKQQHLQESGLLFSSPALVGCHY